MQSLFFFIVALGILIVVHEYGHFWVARRCGVKVLRFSVGFGKPIWSKVGRDGTQYVVCPIPLGGYVKMLDERDETDEPINEADRARSFNRQSLSKRTAIVLAGPLANLIFAVLAYWFLFVSGIPGLKPIIDGIEPASQAAEIGLVVGDEFMVVDGHQTPTWGAVFKRLSTAAEKGGEVPVTVLSGGVERQYTLELAKLGLEQTVSVLDSLGIEPIRPKLSPVIGQVIEGEPADLAGIQTGDLLVSADEVILDSWTDWVKIIQRHPNQSIEVALERNEQLLTVVLTPAADANGKGRIGAGVDGEYRDVPESWQAELRYDVLAAIPQAISQTWLYSVTTLKSFAGMFTGSVSTDNLGGPISIAQMAGNSAEQGVGSFISFLAIISITLGVLNLLPVPMLDGGHLAMFLIEAIRRKPLSVETQIKAQRIGLMLLLTLMFFAFFNDFTRLFG